MNGVDGDSDEDPDEQLGKPQLAKRQIIPDDTADDQNTSGQDKHPHPIDYCGFSQLVGQKCSILLNEGDKLCDKKCDNVVGSFPIRQTVSALSSLTCLYS